jgi:hypothetical protein
VSAKPLILLCVAALGLALAACGESAQQKAEKQVCSARSDIQKQVTQLQGLTLATATTSGVKDSLSSIRGDLQKIRDAQPQLNAERRKQVQAANDEFTSQLGSIAGDLGTNLSISGAGAKLQSAKQQLATAYRDTLQKVDCS